MPEDERVVRHDHPPGARAELARELDRLHRARAAVGQVVIGQDEVIDHVFIALLCGGHVLVESAPGLGKTLLVRTLGTVCGMHFSRIQFTPDLMPADITGTMVLSGENHAAATRFQPGPIFAQMVLTDEINRATPRTQSALLEAMQEGTVTAAGNVYELPKPFFVLATQNPIEMEGTYVLPEAQVDRFFFKVHIPFPSEDVLDQVLGATTGTDSVVPERIFEPHEIVRLQAITREVPIAAPLQRDVARFIRSTQPSVASAGDFVRRNVLYGVSPRGAQVLVLAAKAHALMHGRLNVGEDDLRAIAVPALRHRIHLTFEAEAAGITVNDVIERCLSAALHP